MATVADTIKGLANPYHAYVFGTAFWYFLRGIMRVIAPLEVISWFRPPVDSMLEANDLEIYNVWTDSFGLLSLAMILIAVADAVPLPAQLSGSALNSKAPAEYKKPYARAVVAITMFHHITTGIGAYQHWAKPTHHTIAMDIGVYGNIGLTLLGIAALRWGLNDPAPAATGRSKKKL